MKCDECPFRCFVMGDVDVCVAYLDGKHLAPRPDECHLTPDHFLIIRAMIEGKWKCENCIHHEVDGVLTGCGGRYKPKPCDEWEGE